MKQESEIIDQEEGKARLTSGITPNTLLVVRSTTALRWCLGNCLDRVMFCDCGLAAVLVRRVVLGRGAGIFHVREGGDIQRELFLIKIANRLKANRLWFCFAFGEGVGWWTGSVVHNVSLSSTVGEKQKGKVPWMPGFGRASICSATRPMAGK